MLGLKTARARISNHVSGGQCHLNHLTILMRFSWPSLAYMCTKVASSPIHFIRSKFPDKVHNIPSVQKTEIRSKMNVFETENEIKKLIFSSSSKSCDLDSILTSVEKLS